jgi:hypothetical protein
VVDLSGEAVCARAGRNQQAAAAVSTRRSSSSNNARSFQERDRPPQSTSTIIGPLTNNTISINIKLYKRIITQHSHIIEPTDDPSFGSSPDANLPPAAWILT